MFNRIASILLAVLFLAVNLNAEEIYTLIRIEKPNKQQFLDIHKKGLDIVEYEGDDIEIIVQQDDIEWLNNKGIFFSIEVEDLKAQYRRDVNKDGQTMGGFMTLSEIEAYLDSLSAAYPSIMSAKFSIGTTIQGRDIWAVKVSDNHAVDEDEPELLYVSLIHSREPAAGASNLHFMHHMLSNYGVDSEVTDLVDNREMFFVPVQNPDGYAYNEFTDPGGGGFWRKNRRDNGDGTFGVDLNRNYGTHWGFDDIGSSPDTDGETYRGTAPFSEPETQAIRDFAISRNFTIIRNFHCHGDLELWPPGYDRIFDPYDDFYVNIGDSMTQFNGYSPQVGWRLYPTNGEADDWSWYETTSKSRAIGMTCEIGNSFWPSPAQIPSLVAENVWPNLFLARIADNPFVVGPPLAPITNNPSKSGRGDFELTWLHNDSINPADSFTIYELVGKATVVDDAEANYGYWNTERMSRTTARSHTGARSWHENAVNRSNHWLIGNYPYEVQPNDSLKFWIWYEIENGWDYFYVQVSTDGFNYDNLANDFTTNSNPQGLNLGNGITGASGDWVYAKFDLSAYAGEYITVRFAYFTDWGFTEEGVYLDDIENIDFYAIDSVVQSGVTETSFDFVGHDAGDFWYRLDAIDAQGQVSRVSNIVYVNVPPDYIAGDANGDGNVNLLDLNFMVNLIFRDGPDPNPYLSGDANCDENVNLLDLNFLVNYVFRAGPEPSCP